MKRTRDMIKLLTMKDSKRAFHKIPKNKNVTGDILLNVTKDLNVLKDLCVIFKLNFHTDIRNMDKFKKTFVKDESYW